jgi:copper chaperone CopZ
MNGYNTYYPSGCTYRDPEHNDDRYCPNCKCAIIQALKNIPMKIKRFSKPYDKISLEEIKKAVDIQKKKCGWTKIVAPLFDTKNPDNKNIAGFIKIDGHPEIFYSYWSDAEQRPEYRIEIDMERNLETGEEYIWEDIINKH